MKRDGEKTHEAQRQGDDQKLAPKIATLPKGSARLHGRFTARASQRATGSEERKGAERNRDDSHGGELQQNLRQARGGVASRCAACEANGS